MTTHYIIDCHPRHSLQLQYSILPRHKASGEARGDHRPLGLLHGDGGNLASAFEADFQSCHGAEPVANSAGSGS